jgi:long-subunit acyl-CoA synthetase (AMP-forming)
MTVVDAFRATVDAHPDRVAFRTGDDTVALTWAQLRDRAENVARGLHEFGVERERCVAMLLTNRPEFNVCDLAAMMLGAVAFSIYNSCAPEQIQYMMTDSAAEILITEQALLPGALIARKGLPNLRHIVVVDGDPSRGCSSLTDVERAGRRSTFDVEAASRAVGPDDVATLIYTSGTTGEPKGVEITHANIRSADEELDTRVRWPDGSRVVSWLPAAHIAERIAHYYLPMIHGATVTTCPDPGRIGEYLAAVHPTWFFAVPRVWEKMRSALEVMLAPGSSPRPRSSAKPAPSATDGPTTPC